MKERQKVTALSSRPDHSGEWLSSRGAKWKFAGLSVLIFVLLFSVLWTVFAAWGQESNAGVVLTTPLAVTAAEVPGIIHPFPDTAEGVHVFNDQLAAWEMSGAQFEFAAGHYAGIQKMFASDARRFRSHNPNFVILNYRLGLGLGYRNATGNCEP